MQRFLLLVCVLCMCTMTVYAQKASNNYPIYNKVKKAAEKYAMPEFTIASEATTNLEALGIPKTQLESGKLIDLDMQVIQQLRSQDLDALSLSFPLPKQANAKVNLVRNKVLTPDFILRQSSNPDEVLDYTPGLYYTGTLDNDPASLVSFSIFENEVIAMIHTQDANYVIGKVQNQNTNKHIIYKDSELSNPHSLDCATQDDGIVYHDSDLTFDISRAVGDCVRIYIEIDDDIVTDKGGTTGATNYITGVMNEVITLYANDNLTMAVSEIFAWNTPAPYSGTDSGAMLSSYQANTGTFNGDLSHLVSYQASGGIAAGFSGICNSNPDNSKCFSSIGSTYSTVPTYSFTVMVMTHEMGHLIGSRHTHACVWNGNGTAIDGCAGYVEGSCSLPGSPSGGGTIMSYCHLTTGIDFTQGFGPQPKAVILNTVANATCLSSCSGPTCSDGVQNGDETGVDCGGTSCPPCNSGCNDNVVNVNITFDNYPEETSWTITNSSGTTVASGGTYGNQADGSSISIPLCLVDGCYDFTINDSYGDGICCGYGNGSYSVTDGSGNVLASGGSFGSSETTNFCFNPPVPGCTDPNAHNYDPNATQDDGSCQTCSDGVQNGDETGVDCGGALCAPCSSGCNDNVVNVNITFDNYPEETSWTITNASGTTVASGGTYPNEPDGSTISIPLCLVDGCYDFTINDSYGDGICCGYGNGSYSVTDGSGNVLASGGSFGSSETTNFCLGGGGGGATTIFAHFFETGWDGWADGGSDCYRYSGSRSYEGSYSIRIRDNSGTASSMTSSAYNLSGYASADLEFFFYAYSMENGEDFWVQVNTGSGWQTVASYARGTHFQNNTFYTSTVHITNLSSSTKFRFRCDASSNADHIYIDAVTLTANSGAGLVEEVVSITPLGQIEESPLVSDKDKWLQSKIRLYPNPATEDLTIDANVPVEQIDIYSANGQLLRSIATNSRRPQIDVSTLQSGFYYLSIKTTEGVSSMKFIKR
ncbi:MAG TPA: T9SS type A sorting domain-containing protein [Phaeodactylibacter sp.]|nr:T9SS type A sorting domain-containing protein [Phaeodactylibacter sp.]